MQCCRGEWGFMPSDILKSVQKNKFTPSVALALSIYIAVSRYITSADIYLFKINSVNRKM